MYYFEVCLVFGVPGVSVRRSKCYCGTTPGGLEVDEGMLGPQSILSLEGPASPVTCAKHSTEVLTRT